MIYKIPNPYTPGIVTEFDDIMYSVIHIHSNGLRRPSENSWSQWMRELKARNIQFPPVPDYMLVDEGL